MSIALRSSRFHRQLLFCVLALVMAVTQLPGVSTADAAEPAEPTLPDGQLDRTVTVEFLDTPLGTALERLERETGVTTLIDPQRSANLARIAISLRLTDATVKDALDLMCLSASVDWDIVNGVVMVSTPQVIMQRRLTTEIYDIRGLLVSIQNQVAPTFDLTEALSNTNSGGGGGLQTKSGNQIQGGGGGGSIFGDDGEAAESMLTMSERIEQIVMLIHETVAEAEYWDDSLFTVREIAGSLVIQATPEYHEDIAELLGSLDKQAGRMVQIQGEYFVMPRSILDAALKDNGGGLIVAPDELEDLSATLAESASTRLAATRNVGFNGQRVFVYAGRDRTFLSDQKPIADAPGYDATLSVLRDGVVLDVLPTLVNDGQEVVVAIKSDLIPAETKLRPAGVPDTDVADTQGIESPDRDTLFYRTTVRVPVGGAVVLTGASSLLESIDADDSEIVMLLRVDAVE